MSSSSDFHIKAGRGVVLRRLNGADLAAFQGYRRDPEVGKFQDWSRMHDGEVLGFLNHMAAVDLFERWRWCRSVSRWLES
ncbi:MAG: hypothetical protein QNK92_17285 [Amylibacter sp.]